MIRLLVCSFSPGLCPGVKLQRALSARELPAEPARPRAGIGAADEIAHDNERINAASGLRTARL